MISSVIKSSEFKSTQCFFYKKLSYYGVKRNGMWIFFMMFVSRVSIIVVSPDSEGGYGFDVRHAMHKVEY